MKEAFYFPHDTNATQDEKIICLLKDHGLEGLAIYWIMVELIHQQPNGTMAIDAFDSTVAMYVASFGINKERLFNVRSTFVQRNIFKEENGCITNDRILRNKAHRDKLSNAGKVGGQASAAQRLRTTVQAYKGKERKGKENTYTKEIEEVFNTFCAKLGKNLTLSPERSKIIEQRLKEGRTVEEMKVAIDNFSKDTWEDRNKFCDIVYVLGVRNKVNNLDKWLSIKPKEQIGGGMTRKLI